MAEKNTLRSLMTIGIGLITPLIIWLLLYLAAQTKPLSFDPNPFVRDLYDHPQVFQAEKDWFHWVNQEQTWHLKSQKGLIPMDQVELPPAGPIIFLLEGQGPTLAKQFYEYLVDKKLIERVVILSPSDGLLKDLRFHEPKLTLSCGQAYLVRFEALNRLKLQRLITLDMSVVWLDPKIFGESLDTLTQAFTSVNVPVIIGPHAEALSTEPPAKASLLQ